MEGPASFMTTRGGKKVIRIAMALLAILPSVAVAGEIVPIQSLVARPGEPAPPLLGRKLTIEGVLSSAPLPVGERFCLGYVQAREAAVVLFSSESILCGRFQAGERVRIEGQLATYQGGEEIRVTSALSIGHASEPPLKDA